MKKTYRIQVELTITHEGEYEDDDTPEGEQRAMSEARRDARLKGTIINCTERGEE